MKKKFNVTGLCVPEKHYMVILDKCLDEIHQLIDDGAHFTINRARQYGKTTTLNMLSKMLSKDYLKTLISRHLIQPNPLTAILFPWHLQNIF